MKKFTKILNEEAGDLKEQLILASLFILIFEAFKDYTIETVENFFSDNIVFKNGKVIFSRSAKFKEIIKTHGQGADGQHTNKDFRASLKFFLDLQAITDKDFQESERLYSLRNDIGHELLNVIINDKKTGPKLDDVILIWFLYLKIKLFYFREIEVSISPELYENANLDEVVFPDLYLLKHIILKSLLNIDEGVFLEKISKIFDS